MKKEGILFITLILVVSSTGCLDVILFQDVLNKIRGEDEIIYKWVILIDDEGKFVINMNGGIPTNPNEDFVRIIEKLSTNISNGNIENIQKIAEEENIVFEKDIYEFEIIKDTKTLNLEIDAEWSGYFVGVQGFGYFRVAVKHEDDIVFQDSYLSSESEKKVTIPLTAYSGNWTVEVEGTGLPTPFDYGYHGSHDIKVVAFEPES